MLFCFLRLKFCEFLLLKRSFCIAVSSLAVHLYGYRSSADDFCSKSGKPQKALRTKNSYIHFICLLIALDLYEFLMTQSQCPLVLSGFRKYTSVFRFSFPFFVTLTGLCYCTSFRYLARLMMRLSAVGEPTLYSSSKQLKNTLPLPKL